MRKKRRKKGEGEGKLLTGARLPDSATCYSSPETDPGREKEKRREGERGRRERKCHHPALRLLNFSLLHLLEGGRKKREGKEEGDEGRMDTILSNACAGMSYSLYPELFDSREKEEGRGGESGHVALSVLLFIILQKGGKEERGGRGTKDSA